MTTITISQFTDSMIKAMAVIVENADERLEIAGDDRELDLGREFDVLAHAAIDDVIRTNQGQPTQRIVFLLIARLKQHTPRINPIQLVRRFHRYMPLTCWTREGCTHD